MSTLWNEYGAESLKLGIINFLLVNCRDKSWEFHYQGFFGRWNVINNSNYYKLTSIPKLKSGGTLRLIAPSSEKIAIVLTDHTPWKGSPYFEIVESIKDELITDEMRWPRAEGFDYQGPEWISWISFIGRLAKDLHGLSSSPGNEPHNWTRFVERKFSTMLPLNDRSAILKAYYEHGF